MFEEMTDYQRANMLALMFLMIGLGILLGRSVKDEKEVS